MKLSEIKGEQAIDVLADLLEPAAEIFGDKEFARIWSDQPGIKAVKYALKAHKTAVLEMLAILDGEDPASYSPSIVALPVKLLELFNDPLLVDLFRSQVQSNEETSSGPATENSGATEED